MKDYNFIFKNCENGSSYSPLDYDIVYANWIKSPLRTWTEERSAGKQIFDLSFRFNTRVSSLLKKSQLRIRPSDFSNAASRCVGEYLWYPHTQDLKQYRKKNRTLTFTLISCKKSVCNAVTIYFLKAICHTHNSFYLKSKSNGCLIYKFRQSARVCKMMCLSASICKRHKIKWFSYNIFATASTGSIIMFIYSEFEYIWVCVSVYVIQIPNFRFAIQISFIILHVFQTDGKDSDEKLS